MERSCLALLFSTSLFIYSELGVLNSEKKMAAALSSSTNSEANLIQAEVDPASGKDTISTMQGFSLIDLSIFLSMLIHPHPVRQLLPF